MEALGPVFIKDGLFSIGILFLSDRSKICDYEWMILSLCLLLFVLPEKLESRKVYLHERQDEHSSNSLKQLLGMVKDNVTCLSPKLMKQVMPPPTYCLCLSLPH